MLPRLLETDARSADVLASVSKDDRRAVFRWCEDSLALAPIAVLRRRLCLRGFSESRRCRMTFPSHVRVLVSDSCMNCAALQPRSRAATKYVKVVSSERLIVRALLLLLRLCSINADAADGDALPSSDGTGAVRSPTDKQLHDNLSSSAEMCPPTGIRASPLKLIARCFKNWATDDEVDGSMR